MFNIDSSDILGDILQMAAEANPALASEFIPSNVTIKSVEPNVGERNTKMTLGIISDTYIGNFELFYDRLDIHQIYNRWGGAVYESRPLIVVRGTEYLDVTKIIDKINNTMGTNLSVDNDGNEADFKSAGIGSVSAYTYYNYSISINSGSLLLNPSSPALNITIYNEGPDLSNIVTSVALTPFLDSNGILKSTTALDPNYQYSGAKFNTEVDARCQPQFMIREVNWADILSVPVDFGKVEDGYIYLDDSTQAAIAERLAIHGVVGINLDTKIYPSAAYPDFNGFLDGICYDWVANTYDPYIDPAAVQNGKLYRLFPWSSTVNENIIDDPNAFTDNRGYYFGSWNGISGGNRPLYFAI